MNSEAKSHVYSGETRVRVVNKCNCDIGITLASGQQAAVRQGSFLKIPVDDILFIESTAREVKPFSSKWLVPMTDDGRELTLEELGGYTDPNAQKHLDLSEITSFLKKPAKAVETWLSNIDDPIELHAIAEAAETMDLPASKLKILQAKIPNIDFLSKNE